MKETPQSSMMTVHVDHHVDDDNHKPEMTSLLFRFSWHLLTDTRGTILLKDSSSSCIPDDRGRATFFQLLSFHSYTTGLQVTLFLSQFNDNIGDLESLLESLDSDKLKKCVRRVLFNTWSWYFTSPRNLAIILVQSLQAMNFRR